MPSDSVPREPPVGDDTPPTSARDIAPVLESGLPAPLPRGLPFAGVPVDHMIPALQMPRASMGRDTLRVLNEAIVHAERSYSWAVALFGEDTHLGRPAVRLEANHGEVRTQCLMREWGAFETSLACAERALTRAAFGDEYEPRERPAPQHSALAAVRKSQRLFHRSLRSSYSTASYQSLLYVLRARLRDARMLLYREHEVVDAAIQANAQGKR